VVTDSVTFSKKNKICFSIFLKNTKLKLHENQSSGWLGYKNLIFLVFILYDLDVNQQKNSIDTLASYIKCIHVGKTLQVIHYFIFLLSESIHKGLIEQDTNFIIC
jgi:hypothetical protein